MVGRTLKLVDLNIISVLMLIHAIKTLIIIVTIMLLLSYRSKQAPSFSA
jgi:hypothetical protein